MRERLFLLLILVISSALLTYGAQSISISYDEAYTFFNGNDLVHYLAVYSTQLLGQNDFALRLPFILLHLTSIILLYKIGKLFLKKRIDRIVSVAIYAFLPGVNGVALLVNSGIVVIFFSLLFTYLYLKEWKVASHIVLIICLFVDNSFAIFYIALFVYALMKRKTDLLIVTLILFSASMYLYGFDTGGKPRGYFIDTLGVYAIVFSPLLFLYFVYAMYRILIKEEKNLLWYISFFSLVVSLLLSLRQKLLLEDFAPFVVLSVPLMVKVFFNSYRVRLPAFRKLHTFFFILVLITLFINTMLSFFNKPLYAFMNEPSKHFAINYNIARELANELKARDIHKVITKDDKMALRLKFYNIERGGAYKLMNQKEIEEGFEQIDIAYYGKTVRTFYLYRIN
ncbi:glycosyltransferase family 39 protein [Sulfurospirillum diekertiae]|uniref:Glycosyltransferase family 39 protein n=1 Tax=Sulfurospirillum diekertiae TaxID=1854492 RepID=A0A6G9VNZ3_9BACT|nr:glycosyltransferase family 39 protein [Sulfurospirillum diekertiae]QIR75234.1 glycosyltransferase family 39 protein [Sulfurospirillum diekertiae]QIR77885.1 glycosyltransferase family 39 protein [Sulfurospirillum diekertiae]